MTGILCAISALLGAGVGMWWGNIRGTINERQRAATEARNRAIATQKGITDAIENSHAGGAAWIDRLRDSAK